MRLPSCEGQDEKPCPREDGETQLSKRGQVQDLPLLTAKKLERRVIVIKEGEFLYLSSYTQLRHKLRFSLVLINDSSVVQVRNSTPSRLALDDYPHRKIAIYDIAEYKCIAVSFISLTRIGMVQKKVIFSSALVPRWQGLGDGFPLNKGG